MNGRIQNSGDFLLDTNIIVAILNRDHSITRQLTPEMSLFVPAIALGEILSGAHRSGRVHENLEAAKSIPTSFPVLPCNKGTAEKYGSLHASLKKRGKPIPDNDVWIAAIAYQRGLTLITRDSHFKYIESVAILLW